MKDWLDEIKWDSDGLVPAIAQDYKTGRVLMMAWMNREALSLTATKRLAHAQQTADVRQRLLHAADMLALVVGQAQFTDQPHRSPSPCHSSETIVRLISWRQ